MDRAELIATSELRNYHRNPRRGNVARIRESLRANGQYKPVVVNRGELTGRPNEVLAGNHTLKAAIEEGLDELWVWWVNVDDPEAARIVAADNRTSDFGEYDDRLLAELLHHIDDELGSLQGTAYDLDDLEILERRLDAEAVWDSSTEKHDAGGMADEFGKITGESNLDYDHGLAATVTVKVRDVDSLRQFMHQTGIRGIPTRGRNEGATVFYPPGWKPSKDEQED